MFPKDVEKENQSTKKENDYDKQMQAIANQIGGNDIRRSPFLYSDRRMIADSLTRIELFNKSKDVQGCIVECGVHRGNNLGLFYHLASIHNPAGFNKKIIGFDTFTGFPEIGSNDPEHAEKGEHRDTSYEHIKEVFEIQDKNRSIGHIPTVELVKGDALKTIPEFVKNNKWLVISLLYLDFDLYEPTLCALEHLEPLVPKGGIIAFDEINQKRWEGETIAMKEKLDMGKIKLRCFSYEPHVSYYIKGE